MTTYHVWLVDRVEPEVIEALEVSERDGELWFMISPPVLGESGTYRFQARTFEPAQWYRWAVVHDEADTVHI